MKSRSIVVTMVSVCALMSAMPVLQSLRWQLLMRCRGLPAPTRATFRIYMVGMFFNSFIFLLPIKIAGTSVRIDASTTIKINRISSTRYPLPPNGCQKRPSDARICGV